MLGTDCRQLYFSSIMLNVNLSVWFYGGISLGNHGTLQGSSLLLPLAFKAEGQ